MKDNTSLSPTVVVEDNAMVERLPFSPDEAIERLREVLRMLESVTDHSGKMSTQSPLPKARVFLRGIIGIGIGADTQDTKTALGGNNNNVAVAGSVQHQYEPDAYRVCTHCGAQGDVLCAKGQAESKPTVDEAVRKAAEKCAKWAFQFEAPLTSELDLQVAADRMAEIISTELLNAQPVQVQKEIAQLEAELQTADMRLRRSERDIIEAELAILKRFAASPVLVVRNQNDRD